MEPLWLQDCFKTIQILPTTPWINNHLGDQVHFLSAHRSTQAQIVNGLFIFVLNRQSNDTPSLSCSWSTMLIGWDCLRLSPSHNVCLPFTEAGMFTNGIFFFECKHFGPCKHKYGFLWGHWSTQPDHLILHYRLTFFTDESRQNLSRTHTFLSDCTTELIPLPFNVLTVWRLRPYFSMLDFFFSFTNIDRSHWPTMWNLHCVTSEITYRPLLISFLCMQGNATRSPQGKTRQQFNDLHQ